MTLVIDLQADIERGLMARAQAKGLSLSDYAREILSREALPPIEADEALPGWQGTEPTTEAASNLYDLLSPVRGLLTDEEIDFYFNRTPSTSRPVDLDESFFG